MRTIWLERNRRYFYPELQVKAASFRYNQAKADIRAHIQAWMRRETDDNKTALDNALTYLRNREPSYCFTHSESQPTPATTGINTTIVNMTP